MADNAKNETQAAPKPAKAKGISIVTDRTVFTIGHGTRGLRKTFTSAFTADLAELPPAVQAKMVGHVLEAGMKYLMQQASQVAERNQISAWEKAHPKQEVPQASRFPWNAAQFEADSLNAMKARWELWKTGDLGKDVRFMSPVDRRAADLIEAALRLRLAKEGKAAPKADDMAEAVKSVLDGPAGEKYRKQAEELLARERDAAKPEDIDLAALGL